MVRFQPDTWQEALLRPIAMAAPDASVYVEIMAPDFRFAFALALLVALAVLFLRGRRGITGQRPVLVLAGATALAFVPWTATTANGRYFMAGLLIIGPVCVGLARMLPMTRGFRLTLVAGMVAIQAFAVQQSAPWQVWGLADWTEAPYFSIDIPAELREQPATFVTMSAISYSLVAPQFHPKSRWMNLHQAPAPGRGLSDSRRTEAFIAAKEGGPLLLLIPVVPGAQRDDGLPNHEVSVALDNQLAAYRLGLAQPQSCRFLASRGLATTALRAEDIENPRHALRFGFWLCELARLGPATPQEQPQPGLYASVFRMLEVQCPRFFVGHAGTLPVPGGEMRSYLQAEMKAYVLHSGEVYYKYYRALNPVQVGNIQDVLAGKAKVDCGRIRGRSGLPWNREI
jgi:hypothetical protein